MKLTLAQAIDELEVGVMRLTLAQAIELNAALRALDGYTKDGVAHSYKLSGVTRLNISRNIVCLRPEIDAHNAASAAAFRQIAGGVDHLDPRNAAHARMIAEFNLQNDILLREPTAELCLKKLMSSDLQLDENPIPVTVLAGLDPILDGE